MSTQKPTSNPTPNTTQSTPFLDRIVLFLTPYFLTIAPDPALARADILETLASYGARTRAEMLAAVQIIALGFAALDTLAEAKTMAQDLSPSLRIRYRGCANSLNRSAQLQEKILAKRLASDPPEASHPTAEPINDVPDAKVEETLQQARARIEDSFNRLATPHPAIAAPLRGRAHLSTSAILQAIAAAGTRPQPALTP
jgi:hypothetical protein